MDATPDAILTIIVQIVVGIPMPRLKSCALETPLAVTPVIDSVLDWPDSLEIRWFEKTKGNTLKGVSASPGSANATAQSRRASTASRRSWAPCPQRPASRTDRCSPWMERPTRWA